MLKYVNGKVVMDQGWPGFVIDHKPDDMVLSYLQASEVGCVQSGRL